MQIIKIILILQFSLISGININETANKIISIKTKYKNNRNARCSMFDNIAAKTIKTIEKNAGMGEHLKRLNISQCSLDKGAKYVKKHILNGLIVHSDLPDWHWHEYKVSFYCIHKVGVNIFFLWG